MSTPMTTNSVTEDEVRSLRAELARLRPFVEVVTAFMRSGYDGEFFGEEVAPLFRALAEMERAEMAARTPETGCGTLHPAQRGGV